jgi:fumarate hydratase class I
MNLVDALVELLRRTATDLPPDVETAIAAAHSAETGELARSVLADLLENTRIARAESRPICQDTGLPIFFVKAPRTASQGEIRSSITEAVRRATADVPLRPNAVDSFTGRNTGNGVGPGVPIVYFSEWDEDAIVFDLLLKGAGTENIGAVCKLPDAATGAERDVDGVRKVVLDCVYRAQGRGCPPYVVAVGVAGTKDDAALLSKRQLLRRVNDANPTAEIARFESDLLCEINELGIGAAGLSGVTTAMGVKAAFHTRHPGTFFVDVAFGCWAHRRRRMIFGENGATYE